MINLLATELGINFHTLSPGRARVCAADYLQREERCMLTSNTYGILVQIFGSFWPYYNMSIMLVRERESC